MSPAALRAWPAAGDYRYLEGAGPADLAWEWLRRDPYYRQVGHCPPPKATGPVTIAEAAPPDYTARWGCLTAPDPELRWNEAPLLWTSAVDRSVLRVVVLDAGEEHTSFDLQRCGVPPILVRGSCSEHVLLGRGAAAVRLDVVSGSLLKGRVTLAHLLADDDTTAVDALLRFLHLSRHRGLPDCRPPAAQRWRRQISALRVADALAQGASIRDIGVMLYGTERVRDEWAGEALKSQCRRLIRLARAMAAGGYVDQLQSSTATAF